MRRVSGGETVGVRPSAEVRFEGGIRDEGPGIGGRMAEVLSVGSVIGLFWVVIVATSELAR